MKMKTQTISLKINYCTEWGKCTGIPFFFFFIFFFVSWFFFFFFNIHISTVEIHHHTSLLTKRGQISVTDFSHKKYHLDNPHGIGDSYSAPRYSSNTNNNHNDYLSYRILYKKICLTFNKNVGHMQNVTSLFVHCKVPFNQRKMGGVWQCENGVFTYPVLLTFLSTGHFI